MQTTKRIHLNPNGNLIKINGNIYRHYTRNLTVSLPSIFFAISHGATVYEVLDNGETVKLTTQNYALNNQKIYYEKREKKLEEENRIRNAQLEESVDENTENSENDISEHVKVPESIESEALRTDNEEESSDEDKNTLKKSNRKNSSKKTVEE